jgi:hypothetical protein
MVEFTAAGAMIVSRDGELLTAQQYVAQDNGVGAGRLSLRTEGSSSEVVLGYCVATDILAMSYGGQTTIYSRVA